MEASRTTATQTPPDSAAPTFHRATWNGAVIAQSADTIVVEGNHYFPAAAVDQAFLRPSTTTTMCGWKGEASYYDIVVDGDVNKDAAWYYAKPLPEAKQIEGFVAFWKGVEIR